MFNHTHQTAPTQFVQANGIRFAVALLLGAVATAHGLGFAVDLGAGVIALLSVITVALVAMTRAGSFQIAIPPKSEERSHD